MEGDLAYALCDRNPVRYFGGAQTGESWSRALDVFRHYGFNMAFDVTLILLYAVNQQKLDEVLTFLEVHYRNHLRFHLSERDGGFSPSLTQLVLDQMLVQAREFERFEKLEATPA